MPTILPKYYKIVDSFGGYITSYKDKKLAIQHISTFGNCGWHIVPVY